MCAAVSVCMRIHAGMCVHRMCAGRGRRTEITGRSAGRILTAITQKQEQLHDGKAGDSNMMCGNPTSQRRYELVH